MSDKPSLHCQGRCCGMGDPDPAGSYVRVVYRIPGVAEHFIRISEGEAELLAAELLGALKSGQPASEAGKLSTDEVLP